MKVPPEQQARAWLIITHEDIYFSLEILPESGVRSDVFAPSLEVDNHLSG